MNYVKLFAVLIIATWATSGIGQVAINTTGTTPDSTAMLDISSTNKGVLIPRMDSTERKDILNPANGLLVFDTATTTFWYAQDFTWIEIANDKALEAMSLPAGIETGHVLTTNGSDSVYWSPIVENQTLSLESNLLFITDGDTVDLSPLKTVGYDGLIFVRDTAQYNLDVSQTSSGGSFGNTGNCWQSFTPQETGLLSQVDLRVSTNTFEEGHFTIYEGQGTGGEILARIYLDSINNGYNTFDLSKYNVPIQMDSVYTMRLRATSGKFFININSNNVYADGRANMFASYDLVFRTYTSPTDTSTLITINQPDSDSASINIQYIDTLFFADGSFQTTNLSGDNLGNHTATQNIQTNGNWISGDSDSEGISIDDTGFVTFSGGIQTSNPLILNHTVDTVLTGTPSADGFRIRTVEEYFNENEEAYIFEKTDGNQTNPDGGIVFANTGSDGVMEDALVIRGSGRVGVGRNPTTNAFEVNGQASKSSAGDWIANSDARLKKNITQLNSQQVLSQLLALQGVTYEWNDTITGNDRPDGMQYGFTAQNIQKVFPDLVTEDNQGYLQTAYGTYDAMYVEAIRALKEKVDRLETQVSEMQQLKLQNAEMKAMLQQIQAQLNHQN